MRSVTSRLALLLALPLLAAACRHASPTRPATLAAPVGSALLLTGVVTENRHGCEVDISCELMVDTGRETVAVIYHYGEGQRCENAAVFDQAWPLQRGDRVEVLAEVVAGRSLSLCDALRYYVRPLP
jgi:hypothetical protein